jgi:hypothetical protein
LTDTVEKQTEVRGSSSSWRPLQVSTFRDLLVADGVPDVGTFMQNIGAALSIELLDSRVGYLMPVWRGSTLLVGVEDVVLRLHDRVARISAV